MPQTPAESALSIIQDTIVEVIDESNDVFGVPGGHIYASLMAVGVSLDLYNQIMANLVRTGRIRGPVHHCYFSVRRKADG